MLLPEKLLMQKRLAMIYIKALLTEDKDNLEEIHNASV